MDNKITRRELLKKSLYVLPASILVSTVMNACRKSGSTQTELSKNEQVLPDTCPETYTLTEDDKQARTALRYADKTPISGRTCDNCKLYTLPKLNDVCGGCQILKGPIHPKAYCMSWIKQM